MVGGWTFWVVGVTFCETKRDMCAGGLEVGVCLVNLLCRGLRSSNAKQNVLWEVSCWRMCGCGCMRWCQGVLDGDVFGGLAIGWRDGVDVNLAVSVCLWVAGPRGT